MPAESPEKILVFDALKKVTVEVDRLHLSEEEWGDRLDQKVCYIMRQKGTEHPFSGSFYDHKVNGLYVCAACGNHLFYSLDKFDSGTGWPSFTEPVDSRNVSFQEDRSASVVRTEVLCARCGSHLGHIFDDGPPPSGKRFCINSLALEFLPFEGFIQPISLRRFAP